jgi:hypothetical protein
MYSSRQGQMTFCPNDPQPSGILLLKFGCVMFNI